MGSVDALGTRGARFEPHTGADRSFTARLAEVLAEHDEALLAAYVEDEATVAYEDLRRALAAQTRRARVHPVYFGSAITGAGVDALAAGIRELLPAAEGDVDGPLSGTVFKVERGPAGEKLAYVRMFSGTLRTRERLCLAGDDATKVTAISVFDRGGAVARASVGAGQIGRLRGLEGVSIGDAIGRPPPGRPAGGLRAADARDRRRARPRGRPGPAARRAHPARRAGPPHRPAPGRAARRALALPVRRGAEGGHRGDARRRVRHRRELPRDDDDLHRAGVGDGEAVELIHTDPNPFLATVGLRIEPAPIGSGVRFDLEVELGSMPIAFMRAVEASLREALRQGLHGWEVTDCAVAMTHSGYAAKQSHSHAIFDKSMSSTARDFRQLTPLVAMTALEQAGTTVCEPVHRFALELPPDTLGCDDGRARRAARHPPAHRPPRGGDRPGGRDPGGARARADPAAAVADARRGRARVGLRTLRARPGHDPDAPAHRRRPARPPGVHPARPSTGNLIGTAHVAPWIRPAGDRCLSDVLPRRGHRGGHAALGRPAQGRAMVPARALHRRARDLPRRAGRRGRRTGHGLRRAHARRAHRAPRRPPVGLPGGDRAHAATASITSASARSTTTPSSPATASRATSWPSRPGCRPAAGWATSTRRPSCPATSS